MGAFSRATTLALLFNSETEFFKAQLRPVERLAKDGETVTVLGGIIIKDVLSANSNKQYIV
jgi:hypothetical protein